MVLPTRTSKSGLQGYGEPNFLRVWDAIRTLVMGGGSSWRKIALTASATSTTVTVVGLSANAVAFVEAQDANAQAVSPVINSVSAGSIVIGHSSSGTPGNVGLMWRQ